MESCILIAVLTTGDQLSLTPCLIVFLCQIHLHLPADWICICASRQDAFHQSSSPRIRTSRARRETWCVIKPLVDGERWPTSSILALVNSLQLVTVSCPAVVCLCLEAAVKKSACVPTHAVMVHSRLLCVRPLSPRAGIGVCAATGI